MDMCGLLHREALKSRKDKNDQRRLAEDANIP